MIYQIKDKYYINVAPHIFKEVKICLKNNDLVLAPTNNTIEVYKMYEVKSIYFQHEKENLRKKLFPNKIKETVAKKSRPSKRK